MELTGACAGIEGLLGRHADAQARLELALAGLEDQGSLEAAGLLVSIAGVAFFRTAFDEMRAVARLIVDRKTNAEIAAELYLSRKTVETHVRNLFHTLDVGSRVDVARVVQRPDRATP